MSNSSKTNEMVQFIRRLTFDGELSTDEAWELANHLNEHPECATVWPGTLLVPLLQSIWDDGEVEESELATLGATLRLIESHSAEQVRALNPATESPREPTAAPKPYGVTADQRIPVLLPRIQVAVEIESSDGDSFYTVNLLEHTCTCPDFIKRRTKLPECSPSRACKHMCSAFAECLEEWPSENSFAKPAMVSLAEIGKGSPPDGIWFVVGNAVVCDGAGPWVNVFTDAGAENFESFGFNKTERRWAYGVEPECSSQIEESVCS